MRNRSSKPRSRKVYENAAAKLLIDEIIAETENETGKDPLAVLLGRRGGLKGGKARAAKLSAEKRSEIASNAARARWSKQDGD
ncbi:MAG: histone H1 [Pyrinomonadaceae bacterium]